MSASAAKANPTSHIHVDDEGVAWIGATNVKVVEVVLEKLAHGWSPEEIHFQHRDLTLGQIHAALSWYYDHEDALDAEIARRSNVVQGIEEVHGDSPRRAASDRCATGNESC